MRVTFAALGQELLAVGLLSSLLRQQGHETAIAFDPALFDDRQFLDVPTLARVFDRTDRVVEEVVASQPDLVAFSVLTPTYRWSLAIASQVKQRIDVPVIFGGVHPSAVPEICLENSCVDYVCVGEGELALTQLVSELPPVGQRPSAPIPNLWWRDGEELVQGPAAPFIQDLDSLPTWDKELWEPHVPIADSWLTMTARGCPYRCTFCFNNYFAKLPGKGGGSYLRRRSVDNVMDELHWAKERFGIRHVDFQDDIFTTDKDWLRNFLDRYRREIDLPFNCLVHPRYIDGDMARWLKGAGCVHVQMGVQSADEAYKRQQLLRMEKESHVRASLEDLRSAELDVKVDHILGLPGEPLSAQELARELYAEFTPRRIQTFWLTHLPGVELTRSAVATGDLSEADYLDVCRGRSGRFHSRSVAHASDAHMYRRYELLFRALPVLPRAARSRVRAHHVPAMPQVVSNLIGLALEGINVVKTWDTESFNYARSYRHHLRRQLPELLADLTHRRRRPRHDAPEPDLPLLQRADKDAGTDAAAPVDRLTQLLERSSARHEHRTAEQSVKIDLGRTTSRSGDRHTRVE
jgi:anaerobic magnesium-protoporphyrin IX monomethyl ester cyclase